MGTWVSDHPLTWRDESIVGPPTIVGTIAYPPSTFDEDGGIAVWVNEIQQKNWDVGIQESASSPLCVDGKREKVVLPYDLIYSKWASHARIFEDKFDQKLWIPEGKGKGWPVGIFPITSLASVFLTQVILIVREQMACLSFNWYSQTIRLPWMSNDGLAEGRQKTEMEKPCIKFDSVLITLNVELGFQG